VPATVRLSPKTVETTDTRQSYRYSGRLHPPRTGVLVALTRSRANKLIGGVCGGIAQWLGWDPTLVRILYVLVSILSVAFPGILVYLVLWLVMPAGE